MGLPSRARLVALAVAVVVVPGAILAVRSRDPERQARATFARVKEAVESNVASDVVAELHPDYDFIALWPGLFDNPDTKTALTAGSDDATPRSMAKRGLSLLFLEHLQSHLRFLYTIHRVTARPDGSADVEVTIEVGGADGGGLIVDGLKRHHFVLAPTGWIMGGWKIRSHDTIEIAVPH